MISWIFLGLSLPGAWLAWNVVRPSFASGRRAAISFLAGWLIGESALHQITAQALVTLAFAAGGALDRWPGKLGFLVTLGSWALLALGYLRSWGAEGAVESALRDGLGGDYRSALRPELSAALRSDVDWRSIALPFPLRHPDVERIRDIRYARARGLNLKLDVYCRRDRPRGAPVLFEIHGGGWIIGSKNEQGIPMMLRMAAQGWVCVSADYRLSPHATFPEHLIDCKRALEWIRRNVAEYGGDPDFVVVAGQSAGGHLASQLALTANDPEYQPGFPSVDTSVEACATFYGVYDFTDRFGLWPCKDIQDVLEQKVLKASLEEDRDAWERASPMSRVHAEAPPFLIVHGDADTLVPVAEARRFAEMLRAVSLAPVAYAEIPGAQHAFELFPSLRTDLVLGGVERFLAWVQSRRAAESPADVDERAVG